MLPFGLTFQDLDARRPPECKLLVQDDSSLSSRSRLSVSSSDDLFAPNLLETSEEDQAVAEDLMKLSKTPSKRALTDKTIVLDMDLTLICTIGDGSDLSQRMRISHRGAYEALVRKGVIVPTTLTQFGGSGRAVHNDVIKRPGMDQFLSFCKQVFKHVILWSAGQASYVYDVVKLVIDPMDIGIFDHIYTANDVINCSVGPETVDAMMTGDADCEQSQGSAAYAASLRASGFVSFSTKPIKNLNSKFPAANLSSTIIVDDLPCNFLPNPRNGILIPPFSPNLKQILANAVGPLSGPLNPMSGDYCLFRLLHYFADDDFLKADDVRQCDLKFFKEVGNSLD